MSSLKYQREIDTPSWKLFNSSAECSVQASALPTDAYLERVGISVGDPDRDRYNALVMVPCNLRIPRIVEIWDSGAPIRIKREDQVNKIYQHIIDHIYDWSVILTSPFTWIDKERIDAVMKDLITLNRYAAFIHERAMRYQFKTKQRATSRLGRKFTWLQSPMSYEPPVTTEDVKSGAVKYPRYSGGDVLETIANNQSTLVGAKPWIKQR